jgi:DNA-directed RNA polymerase specialized sigma24 family protein
MTELHSRLKDGGFPVHILEIENGTQIYEVEKPSHQGKIIFNSARQLLIDLTRHPQGRNWTFDRYFKLGKWASDKITTISDSVFDLFGYDDNPPIVMPAPNAPEVNFVQTKSTVTIPVGIDLINRGHEVAKLFYAGFAIKLANAGYDPQEVLQEVYSGILTRNKGTCPWDPNKSSFGHYVHMIIGCVVSNYIRKHSKTKMFEQVGVVGFNSEGELDVVDAAGVKNEEPCLDNMTSADLQSYIATTNGRTSDGSLAVKIFPMVQAGYSRLEIAEKFNVSKATVNKAVGVIKTVSKKWASV